MKKIFTLFALVMGMTLSASALTWDDVKADVAGVYMLMDGDQVVAILGADDNGVHFDGKIVKAANITDITKTATEVSFVASAKTMHVALANGEGVSCAYDGKVLPVVDRSTYVDLGSIKSLIEGEYSAQVGGFGATAKVEVKAGKVSISCTSPEATAEIFHVWAFDRGYQTAYAGYLLSVYVMGDKVVGLKINDTPLCKEDPTLYEIADAVLRTIQMGEALNIPVATLTAYTEESVYSFKIRVSGTVEAGEDIATIVPADGSSAGMMLYADHAGTGVFEVKVLGYNLRLIAGVAPVAPSAAPAALMVGPVPVNGITVQLNENTELVECQVYAKGDITAVENTAAAVKKAAKRIENGQLVIEHKGVRFNVLGAQVK